VPNGKRKEGDKRAALNTHSRGQQRALHSAIIRARAYSSFRVDGGANSTGQGPVKGCSAARSLAGAGHEASEGCERPTLLTPSTSWMIVGSLFGDIDTCSEDHRSATGPIVCGSSAW
jgi:hypothetical protein